MADLKKVLYNGVEYNIAQGGEGIEIVEITDEYFRGDNTQKLRKELFEKLQDKELILLYQGNYYYKTEHRIQDRGEAFRFTGRNTISYNQKDSYINENIAELSYSNEEGLYNMNIGSRNYINVVSTNPVEWQTEFNPTDRRHPATKGYVDDKLSTFKSGILSDPNSQYNTEYLNIGTSLGAASNNSVSIIKNDGIYFNGEGDSKSFIYTGEDQYITLEPGTYNIELIGAGSNTAKGGKFTGTITVSETTDFTIVVGQSGMDVQTYQNPYGFGGQCNFQGGKAGGGLTGLFLQSEPVTSNSADRAVVIAGGAGGGCDSYGNYGGEGGGLVGENGHGDHYGTRGDGGTQTGHGEVGVASSDQFFGGNGIGEAGYGGGGGRWGGNGNMGDESADDDCGAGGGSGYMNSDYVSGELIQGGGIIGSNGYFKIFSIVSEKLIGTSEITIDSELSEESENPVQNKVITDYLNKLPTPVTPGNGTVVINQGGVKKGEFTLNQNEDITINLEQGGGGGGGGDVYNSKVTVKDSLGVREFGDFTLNQSSPATVEVPIAEDNKPGLVAGGNGLTVNQTSGKMEAEELTKSQFDSVDGKTFVSKTTLNNVLNNSGFITKNVNNLTNYTKTSDLSDVAISGSYNDLSNKPTIPTVNDSAITINQGGVQKGTFTLNQSSNLSIDLDIGSANTKAWNITSLNAPTTLTEIKTHIGTYGANSGVIVHYQDNVYVGPSSVGNRICLRSVRPTNIKQTSYTTITTQALAFTIDATSFELIENYSTQGNYISAAGGNYTEAFMPTEDWQPATKKYVDEHGGGGGGGGIASDTITREEVVDSLPANPDSRTLYFIKA